MNVEEGLSTIKDTGTFAQGRHGSF